MSDPSENICSFLPDSVFAILDPVETVKTTAPIVTPVSTKPYAVHSSGYFLGTQFENKNDQLSRIQRLKKSKWKVIDDETTGLTPYSEPVKNNKLTKIQRETYKRHLRARVLTAAWWSPEYGLEIEAWDLDLLEKDVLESLMLASMTGIFIGHNALFDLSWNQYTLHFMNKSVSKVWPELVLDTMHLGRQLFPESRRLIRNSGCSSLDPRQKWITQRLIKDRGKENWGSSLEDLAYALNLPLAFEIDKGLQKPENWIVSNLTEDHYSYVMGDVLTPLVAIHRLFTDKDIPIENDELSKDQLIRSAVEWFNENPVDVLKERPDLKFYTHVTEPSIQKLVEMSRKGMPFDFDESSAYGKRKRAQLNELINLELETKPEQFTYLYPIRNTLREPSEGMTEVVIKAWVSEFLKANPKAVLPTTAKGEYSLSNKDLKKRFLHIGKTRPVYLLLKKIQEIKQRISMVESLLSFVSRGIRLHSLALNEDPLTLKHNVAYSRLHAMLGYAPSSDRLSSNEPNQQNFPRDFDFRALVKARENYVIISADYGQVELRIAAALALRTQFEINRMMALPLNEWKETTELGKKAVDYVRKVFSLHTIQKLDENEAIAVSKEKLADIKLNAKIKSFNKEDFDIDDAGNVIQPNIDEIKETSYQDLKDERDLMRLIIFSCRVRKSQILRNEGMVSVLADGFRAGVDPHTLTGLKLAQEQGLDIGHSDPLELIKQKIKESARHIGGAKAPDSPISLLKQQYNDPYRENAKPINFGLLYGMTVPTLHINGITRYDLSWSLDDASKSSDVWFKLYPELGLWQYWTILRPEWEGMGLVANVNAKTTICSVKGKLIRSWRTTSLYGRTFIREAFREALNYQDQGTGAHMILRAMGIMPENTSQYLIDQIHDELLAEVPEVDKDHHVKVIRKAMIEAAEEVLKPYDIPCEVDIHVEKYWVH